MHSKNRDILLLLFQPHTMTKQLRNFVVMPFKETSLYYKSSLYELKTSENIAWYESIVPVLVWPKAPRSDDQNEERRKNGKKMWMSYQSSTRNVPMFYWNLPKVWFGWPEMYAIQKYLASEIGCDIKELHHHVNISFLNWFA